MKKLVAILFFATFTISAFSDSLWSERFNYEGSLIDPDQVAILEPSDNIIISSALSRGTITSLVLSVRGVVDQDFSAMLFQSNDSELSDQTFKWDFRTEEYKDFKLHENYVLSESVLTDKEIKTFNRTVELVPEPVCLLFMIVCLFLFRRHLKKVLIVSLAIISLNSFADGLVQDVKGVQFWPFNGSIIINYTLNAPEGNTFPVYKVKFYGSYDGGKTVFDLSENGTVEQDGADGVLVGEGDYKAVWTPDESFKTINTANMQIKLEAEDITDQSTYLVLDLNTYKLRNTNIGPMEDPGILTNNTCRTEELWMRRIEPGTFIMGSPNTELFRNYLHETQHEVTLTKSFYIAAFEMTDIQYRNVLGTSYQYGGVTNAISYVFYETLRGYDNGSTWPQFTDHRVDEDSFLGKLRSLTGNKLIFDLPTEAQWEYACRAGTTTSWNDGTDISTKIVDDNLDKLGWYCQNAEYSSSGPYIGGRKKPNAWGLYDMHGNVWEWCLDWYDSMPNNSIPVVDPVGTTNSESGRRILRGGSWNDSYYKLRASARCDYDDTDIGYLGNYVGFRLVLVPRCDIEEKSTEAIQKTFKYTISASARHTLPVFETKFYAKTPDGTEYPLEEIAKLEGDGASGIVLEMGNHKLTWYPNKDFVDIADQLELRVEYLKVTDSAKYLVLNLKTNKMRCSQNGPDLSNDKCRTEELWLRRVEPGTFTMGSHAEESGHGQDEYLHRVTLSQAFYIGVFEITQYQYRLITGKRAGSIIYGWQEYSYNYANGYGLRDTEPIFNTYYNEIRGTGNGALWPKVHTVDDDSFLGKLRISAGNVFDLPTEAQWEYACRAGTTSSLNDGTTVENNNNLDRLGWYTGNSGHNYGSGGINSKFPTFIDIVGKKVPNSLGLYDMHGNVWEWCRDWYAEYPHGAVTNPIGPYASCNMRVLRGGAANRDAASCRSGQRFQFDPDGMKGYYEFENGAYNGFRVALISADMEDETFEYTIDSGNEDSVFTTKFYGVTKNGKEYLLDDLGSIFGEGSSGLVFGNGKHKITWIPNSGYRSFINQFDLKVEFEDITDQATYLVFNLNTKKVSYTQNAPDLTNDKCRTEELWLRRIEPGKFMMGSPTNEAVRSSSTEVQHEVVLTKAFYMGIFEMTQKQFKTMTWDYMWNPAFTGSTLPMDVYPRTLRETSMERDDNLPRWPFRTDHIVGGESIFGQIRAFTKNAFKFDLPTEAQWEYACRAGTTTAWNNGTIITNYYSDGNLDKLGCYNTNKYVKVGSFLPNSWGLYDMHGNVCEWCLDYYDKLYGGISSSNVDPVGPKYQHELDYARVIRGGSYSQTAANCRAAWRYSIGGGFYGAGTAGVRIVIVP